MKYMGSKARLMKYIKPIIEKELDGFDYYVEPFAGGMNSICEIDFPVKIAGDSNKYLIAMWKSLMDGKRFSHSCRKDEYDKLRKQYRGIEDYGYKDDEIGWYGFTASFNGRFFDGGYNGNYKKRDYTGESARNIENQISKMKNVSFYCSCYTELNIPENSLIYCDIPYKGTKQYGDNKNFDYNSFYEWCCVQKDSGNKVLVSEFNIPHIRFEVVWQKEIITQIGLNNNNHRIEKLFKVI